jgi:hypothetical protein
MMLDLVSFKGIRAQECCVVLLKFWITNPKNITQLLSLTKTIWNSFWVERLDTFVLHFLS